MRKKDVEKSIIAALSGEMPPMSVIDAAKGEMRLKKIENKQVNIALKYVMAAITVVILVLAIALPVALGKGNKNGSETAELKYVVAYSGSVFDCDYTESEGSFAESIKGYGNFRVIIDSVSALREMDEAHGNVFFGGSGEFCDNELCEKIRGYDDGFFEKKELLYVVISVDRLEMRAFGGLELIDGKLTLNVEKPVLKENVEFAQKDISYVFLFELDKSVGKREVVVNIMETDEMGKADEKKAKQYYSYLSVFAYGYEVSSDMTEDENGVISIKTSDMIGIDLDTWFFTSGVPNNLITFKYVGSELSPDKKKVKFECKAEDGDLWWKNQMVKEVTLSPDNMVSWIPGTEKSAYIEVIAFYDGNVMGYALIEAFCDEDSGDYKARVDSCEVFPKAGDHQNITKEYVSAIFEKKEK